MSEPVRIRGEFMGGNIKTEWPHDIVGATVLDRKIVVIKNAFRDAGELLRLRSEVFRWGLETPVAPEPTPTENTHVLQAGISAIQKTPHVYHSYNLNRISQLPSGLRSLLTKYFTALTNFQNGLTGNNARMEVAEEGRMLHPQVIQYPAGGGMFGRHRHPLEPQRIGVIVALSRHGVDFTSGGTCFEVNGEVTDIEAVHELGDIALFRFDLPHWVKAPDLRDKFDWQSERGRWIMALPYY